MCLQCFLLGLKFKIELQCELFRERVDDGGAGRMRALLQHGRDGLCETARHDVLEIPQVGGMVQSEAVRGDPAADVDANGGDFSAVDPDSGSAFEAVRMNVELCEGVDERLFDGANIRDYVALPFAEIEDGVTDDLAGAMIGDVAAAIGVMELDAGALENLGRREEICKMAVPAQRDDMGVLDDEERVGDFAALARVDELFLDGEGFGVGDIAQVLTDETARADERAWRPAAGFEACATPKLRH